MSTAFTNAPDSFRNEVIAALGLPSTEVSSRIESLFAQSGNLTPGKCVEQSIPICQWLHGHGRSFDAITLVQACVKWAAQYSDELTSWKANNVAGIILGDTGDYAAALEHHHASMKLAQRLGDTLCEARSWNNSGLIFLAASAYDIAIECFLRTAKTTGAAESSALYSAFVNIAQCELHLGAKANLRTGIRSTHEALRCERQSYIDASPYSAILLRAGYARLLARQKRLARARAASLESQELSVRMRLPRGQLIAMIADSTIDVAGGNIERGIARLSAQMPLARKIPGLLVDALSTLAFAELQRGQRERAEVYYQEINDFVYVQATEQAYRHLRIAASRIPQAKSRYSAADQWGPMLEWDAFERLAIRAELSTSGDVWRASRVGTIARLIAIEMGYDEPFATEIGYACRLHDIGMIAVSGAQYSVDGEISQAFERLAMQHVIRGPEILGTSSHPRAVMASGIARYHHEHWDGNGYPDNLRGESIPSPARICAISEAFERLTRGDFSDIVVSRAVDEINRQSGTKLDPSMVRALTRSVREGYIHNYMQSDDWRMASRTHDIENIMRRFSR